MAAESMDLEKLKALIDLVGTSPITELELDDGTTRVRIAGSVRGGEAASTDHPEDCAAEPPASTVQLPPTSSEATRPSGAPVPSPMTGVFYRRPSPLEAPFVEVGSQVRPGDTLALVEAMKMLNKVLAERPGTVRAILADDGSMVEDDQPLFLID